ncbi:hypothetical protein [Actinoallomurus acaciae]|uniref:Uncharacterized protein n=1 Tax=Actinoallomurus acaciae TaxID=502577 RepID=A0ABV5YUG8_9ACTN
MDVAGLLVHDIAGSYFSSIVASVTRAAEEQGAIVVLGTVPRDRVRRDAAGPRHRPRRQPHH